MLFTRTITNQEILNDASTFLNVLHKEFPTVISMEANIDTNTYTICTSTPTTQEQNDRLDEILSTYIAPRKFKIYRYADQRLCPTDPPFDLNYKTDLNIRLTPKPVFVQGELQEVTYYSVYDFFEPIENDRYKDPILKVTCVYHRDSLGFALYRQIVRQWYYEDGTLCRDLDHMKVTLKVYDELGSIREGKRRRQNIIDGLMIPILKMLVGTELSNPASEFSTQGDLIIEARRFLASCKQHIISFVDDSSTAFYQFLSDATESWLDNVINSNGVTIRQYIMNEIHVQVVE